MLATWPLLAETDFPALQRGSVETLQVNLGYRCNQSCLHCHVNAGPKRTEMMTGETVDAVIDFIYDNPGIRTLDLTGGAPELNSHFRRLVNTARDLGLRVIDRCNLTILEEPGQEDLARFLAEQQVDIVASLPCYLEENVDRQRGKGVFQASLAGLRKLNALGYGHAGSELRLDLVYNPQGATLPPPQQALEDDYRNHLRDKFGIVFSRLLTLTNMPIQRFGSTLISKGLFNDYMQRLRASFQAENLAQVMCLNLISLDWQGYLYDCDFNQQLTLPLGGKSQTRLHISDVNAEKLEGLHINVADHCYGCTAGQGSSCGGALSRE